MPLDPAANFVREGVTSSIGSADTTIDVADASAFPDPSNGNYNVVVWDPNSANRPDAYANVEIVRVTGRDTGTNTLTVTRAQEGTSAASHADTSVVQLSYTAKLQSDLDSQDPVSFDPGMTEWEDGLSNEEIWRKVLQAGETLVVERIEFRQKGGGSSASASIDVRDTTAASTIGSQDLGGTTKDPGSSGAANTVIIRLNNSTGGTIDAAPSVYGYITGA